MKTPRPTPTVEIDTPWLPASVSGRAYRFRDLGCEHTFELDGWLLYILGDSFASMVAAGLEGVLPALLKSALERFDGLSTIDEVREEWQSLIDGTLGDIEIVEYIGRICGAVAPKVADMIREALPQALARIDGRVSKDLVRLCMFNALQAQDANGVWFTVSKWEHLDAVLGQIPRGPKRQIHKWLLLLKAIEATWGPFGAADPTHPEGERPEQDTGAPLH